MQADRRGRGAWLGWLGVMLGLLMGCASAPGEAERQIRVGLIAPLTGSHAEMGQAALNAAQMAVAAVNDEGGLLVDGERVPVLLLVEDNRGDAELSTSAALKLVNQEQVVALVGPYLDRNVLAVTNVAERASVPLISPTSTAPETTAGRQYTFRATFTNEFQARVMAQFALENLTTNHWAGVLYDIANPYNRGIAESFRAAFEGGEGQVRAFESYTTGEQDFTEALQAILAHGNLEVLILPNYPQDVAAQVEQARALGIYQTILASDALGDIDPAAYPALRRVFLTAPWHLDVPYPASAPFIEGYRAAYNSVPTSSAALTYDSLNLLFQAIEQQDTVAGEGVRAGLTAITGYEGVTGTISFNGANDPVKSVVILQVSADDFGFYRIVEPEEALTPLP